MLFEIRLYVEQRMAGRVVVGDGRIVAVVENGRRRTPRSESFNAAAQHIMDETDLKAVNPPQQIGKKSHFTTYRYTYRKPGVYIRERYGQWACAYEKDGFWWVHRLNRQTDTCFRTKTQAKADVDSHVGYDYVGDLHKKTVDKFHQTERSKQNA